MKHRSLLLTLLLVSMLAFSGISTQAQDCVCPPDALCECIEPPIWGVFTNPQWLKIDHHRVNIEIEDQIARTSISMEFVNTGEGLAEGTFIFPLPVGASVDELIMYINDVPIEARILEADEARDYYDEIVRQYRDPALLEYIGMNAIQANVFPIPPGETRRIELSYTQILEVDNGLIHYSYPLDVTQLTSERPIDSMSISVQVNSDDPISTVYSPSHSLAVSRNGDTEFSAGFEQSNFVPDQDFSLYYGIASDEISLNLLSYRESANEDGFFTLVIQPPLQQAEENIVARDLIIVLDQSGSMSGNKWPQAQAATEYILNNLNSSDRFNVVMFSTGWRLFSNELTDSSNAQEAIDWVNNAQSEGGTDINGSLLTALDMVSERQATIIFLTDGLPTEGETNIENIIENIQAAAQPNVRIFTFGIGDDVDTFLLDTIATTFNGIGSYVRTNQRIDEVLASFYNKISAPVLTDVTLTVDGVMVESLYPAAPLPDLYAGTQLTIVGRYRGDSTNATVTLTGMNGDEEQTFVYSGLTFRQQAGGESFAPRLWATRRIGALLNNIRLQGENPELVESIVSLSIRYGIITPYTSFLIDENDILSQGGFEDAIGALSNSAETLRQRTTGGVAVDAAASFADMEMAEVAAAPVALPEEAVAGNGNGSENGVTQNPIQTVGGKTFLLQDGVWMDTTYVPESMTTTQIEFLSDAYFDLLSQHPELGAYLALGDRVIVVTDAAVYEITVAEAE